MINHEKEVRFDLYCLKCEYAGTNEAEEPCSLCLNEPMNINSHKPLYFKEKEE